MLLLVLADGGYLEMPNCKKAKWLQARMFVRENWFDSIEKFFVSHFAVLVTEIILTGLSFIFFEITRC